MRQKLKNSVVFVLIATLWVATQGISLHTLYCLCRDSLSVSLFSLTDPCERAADATTIAQLPKCCQKKATAQACPLQNGIAKNESHKCTQKGVKHYKVSTPFVVDKLSIFKAGVQVGSLPPIFVLPTWETTVYCSIRDAARACCSNKAPPPLRPYGKTLLPHIATFLC